MKSHKEFAPVLHMSVKVLMFALSVSNFVFIWLHRKIATTTTITFCAYCPWYETWSFTNEPSILLLAACLILFSRQWSYLSACALSGYVVAYVSFYLMRSIGNFGLFELWKGIGKSEPNIFLIWELQLVWAGIILLLALYYLRDDKRRRVTPTL